MPFFRVSRTWLNLSRYWKRYVFVFLFVLLCFFLFVDRASASVIAQNTTYNVWAGFPNYTIEGAITDGAYQTVKSIGILARCSSEWDSADNTLVLFDSDQYFSGAGSNAVFTSNGTIVPSGDVPTVVYFNNETGFSYPDYGLIKYQLANWTADSSGCDFAYANYDAYANGKRGSTSPNNGYDSYFILESEEQEFEFGVCGNGLCEVDDWVDFPENVCTCPEDCGDDTLDDVEIFPSDFFGFGSVLSYWYGGTYDWDATAFQSVAVDVEVEYDSGGGFSDFAHADEVDLFSSVVDDDYQFMRAILSYDDLGVTPNGNDYRFRTRVSGVVCADLSETTYPAGEWSDWVTVSDYTGSGGGFFADTTISVTTDSVFSAPVWSGEWSDFSSWLSAFLDWLFYPDIGGLIGEFFETINYLWDVWPLSYLDGFFDVIESSPPSSVCPFSFVEIDDSYTGIELDFCELQTNVKAKYPDGFGTVTDVLAYVLGGVSVVLFVIFKFYRR